MFSTKLHTFFAIAFKGVVGDHDHPAIPVALFDVVENIDAAFAWKVNIKHGNLWVQLIYERCCIVIVGSRMKPYGSKIF